MKTTSLGAFEIAFSHGQFLVYDVSVEMPECLWTADHANQGFARRKSVVCPGTYLQDGNAWVRVYHGSYDPQQDYLRVIATPFFTPTGRIVVSGLMEMYIAHLIRLRPGNYRVYTCQALDDAQDEHELIDLFFLPEAEPSNQSEIILADEGLMPPPVLVEQAEEISG